MELIGLTLYGVALGLHLRCSGSGSSSDWVQVFARSWSPRGPLLVVLEVVYSTTDPPIQALRRVIPPLRLGSIALDLSFIIVMVAAYLLAHRDRQGLRPLRISVSDCPRPR